METANLYCPREMVFSQGRMKFLPIVPNVLTPLSGSMLEIEVNILEVEDEKALIWLPELLRKDEKTTAIVGINHLN